MSEQLTRLLAGHTAMFGHRPWPRYHVDHMLWVTIGQAIADGSDDLMALWGDNGMVHMAVRPAPPKTPCVISTALRNSEFPSIGKFHPPAIRLERAIRDLYGFSPFAAQDKRPWLD